MRAKLGKPLGGSIPYGFRTNKHKELELDPVEAPIRREIYQLFLANPRFKAVATTLNNRGLRTKRGAKFSGTTIRHLIEDPISKGKRRINYTQSTGQDKRWVEKPENEWKWIDVPAIVDEKLWNECNALIKKRTWKRVAKSPTYLFSGVAMCQCGGKMYVPTKSKVHLPRLSKQDSDGYLGIDLPAEALCLPLIA